MSYWNPKSCWQLWNGTPTTSTIHFFYWMKIQSTTNCWNLAQNELCRFCRNANWKFKRGNRNIYIQIRSIWIDFECKRFNFYLMVRWWQFHFRRHSFWTEKNYLFKLFSRFINLIKETIKNLAGMTQINFQKYLKVYSFIYPKMINH